MAGPVILQPVERRWACPSCSATHVTRMAMPHTPTHPCRGLGGLSTPFVEVLGHELEKHATRHVLVEREDYIGGELVQYHQGRPLMALRTERADGSNDIRVYAPTATLRVG